jgi:hypothetical protein
LALLDITDIVLLGGYSSRELAIFLCLSVVTGISVGWILDMQMQAECILSGIEGGGGMWVQELG